MENGQWKIVNRNWLIKIGYGKWFLLAKHVDFGKQFTPLKIVSSTKGEGSKRLSHKRLLLLIFPFRHYPFPLLVLLYLVYTLELLHPICSLKSMDLF